MAEIAPPTPHDVTPVWLEASRGVDPAPVIAHFAARGLQLAPRCSSGPTHLGLLIIDHVDATTPDMVRDLSRDGRDQVCVVLDAETPMASSEGWNLLDAGAADVIDGLPNGAMLDGLSARFARWAEIDHLVNADLVRRHLVGDSPVWVSCLRRIVEAARFSTAPVLLMGESGTGKELAARLLHRLDPRVTKEDLVVLDCGAVVASLCGSEFFGHERGAFTGAMAARDGAFALADGGGLFLDEIGELPLELQPKLLRVIQEGQFKRVGGNRWLDTNFRLISATNRDLETDVAAENFRIDLYHRLAGIVIHLPDLRARSADIPLIAEHLLAEGYDVADQPILSEPVRQFLISRPYPGNVRDLMQLVHRIAQRHVGPGPITIGDIPEDERPASPPRWPDLDFEAALTGAVVRGVGLKEATKATRDLLVRLALEQAEGDLGKAAAYLGVTRRALEQRRAQSHS